MVSGVERGWSVVLREVGKWCGGKLVSGVERGWSVVLREVGR